MSPITSALASTARVASPIDVAAHFRSGLPRGPVDGRTSVTARYLVLDRGGWRSEQQSSALRLVGSNPGALRVEYTYQGKTLSAPVQRDGRFQLTAGQLDWNSSKPGERVQLGGRVLPGGALQVDAHRIDRRTLNGNVVHNHVAKLAEPARGKLTFRTQPRLPEKLDITASVPMTYAVQGGATDRVNDSCRVRVFGKWPDAAFVETVFLGETVKTPVNKDGTFAMIVNRGPSYHGNPADQLSLKGRISPEGMLTIDRHHIVRISPSGRGINVWNAYNQQPGQLDLTRVRPN